MYPFFRAIIRGIIANRQPKIDFLATTTTRMWIGPFDIDPWLELNNGRTLTLYDLGRIPHFQRTGTTKPILKAGMYLTVAGVSVRYRGRIRPFTTVEMRTRVLGWDDRFVYVEQSLWQNGDCANQMLLRQVIVKPGQGIVDPKEVADLVGVDPESPVLPEWVINWIEADATRPWPPENAHR